MFLTPWKKPFIEYRESGNKFFWGLACETKRRADQGGAPESWTRHLFESRDALNLSDKEIQALSASIFGAGSDTTSGTLLSGILAMVCFPEVQKKAQEEIDRVVGNERSPTWEDEAQLPYLKALTEEVLRWRPVAVLGGTPHSVVQDDVYEGYNIPKGSTILCNLWAIHRDPKMFPEPDQFKPERFLDPNSPKYPQKSGHSGFGWGRRICPGEHLARNSLYMGMARLLWGFNFAPNLDPKTGKPIYPDTFDYTDGFNSRPASFKCKITPRSAQHVAIMKREKEEAWEFLQTWEP